MKEHPMDILIVIAAVLGGLTAFAAAALRFGVDSRTGLGDDHRR